jgi:rhodanese-related sulfurtransferase
MITITSTELEKKLSANPGLTVLDVRTPVEFEQTHIEGSINIPLDQFNPSDFLKNNSYPKEHKVYLICQSGQRSQHAAKLFDKEGLSGGIVIEGGLAEWIKAGFKVKTGSTKVISLERQVRIAAGSLVLLGLVLAKFFHPAFIWLSAFVGAGLINAGITDWCGMGLLLARLPWNQLSKANRCC